jgi:DNA-binding transcriptional LysR family regulator
MEMHQVRYFLAVCDELNFTRAAEKCHVAQPSLTRAIKLLEDELGGPLFHRERANTHLSELGRMVRPYLSEVYDQAQTAKRQAQDFTKLKRTPLKLGIMCTIAPTNLLELVSALQTRHPGVELQIIDSSANALHDRLLGGDLEVAIYCRPKEPPDERLHCIPLFREQFMIVVQPGHRLAERNAIRVEDLRGERYLNRSSCELIGYGVLGDVGKDFDLVYRSERDDWILAMIAAGLGFMPEHSVNHPGVVARPVVDPELWREVNLVTVRGRPHSPAVGALVREAMRVRWVGQPALAVQAQRQDAGSNADLAAAETSG